MRLEHLNEERYCPECGSRPVRRGRQFCTRCTRLRDREGIGEAEPDFDGGEATVDDFLGATANLPRVQRQTAPETNNASDPGYTSEEVYDLYLNAKKSGQTELARKLYDKWLSM